MMLLTFQLIGICNAHAVSTGHNSIYQSSFKSLIIVSSPFELHVYPLLIVGIYGITGLYWEKYQHLMAQPMLLRLSVAGGLVSLPYTFTIQRRGKKILPYTLGVSSEELNGLLSHLHLTLFSKLSSFKASLSLSLDSQELPFILFTVVAKETKQAFSRNKILWDSGFRISLSSPSNDNITYFKTPNNLVTISASKSLRSLMEERFLFHDPIVMDTIYPNIYSI